MKFRKKIFIPIIIIFLIVVVVFVIRDIRYRTMDCNEFTKKDYLYCPSRCVYKCVSSSCSNSKDGLCTADCGTKSRCLNPGQDKQ